MQGSASSGADPCVPKFIDLVFESATESKEILESELTLFSLTGRFPGPVHDDPTWGNCVEHRSETVLEHLAGIFLAHGDDGA